MSPGRHVVCHPCSKHEACKHRPLSFQTPQCEVFSLQIHWSAFQPEHTGPADPQAQSSTVTPAHSNMKRSPLSSTSHPVKNTQVHNLLLWLTVKEHTAHLNSYDQVWNKLGITCFAEGDSQTFLIYLYILYHINQCDQLD